MPCCRACSRSVSSSVKLLALSWIPELQWFVASAVDLGTAQVVEVRPLLPAIALFLVLFLAEPIFRRWLQTDSPQLRRA